MSMTFPTTLDYNALLAFFLDQLTGPAEALNRFMCSTEPYVFPCARKKVLFLLFFETTIVFAFLYEARRAKHLALTYLPFKIYALTAVVHPLSGY